MVLALGKSLPLIMTDAPPLPQQRGAVQLLSSSVQREIRLRIPAYVYLNHNSVFLYFRFEFMFLRFFLLCYVFIASTLR